MTSAQVGIGTEDPNLSAQLEVYSTNSGILIPRVTLESTTDRTTIRFGNVNSLMVFNTQTINDVTPGFYYWYTDRWYKMANTSDDFDETITTLIDQGGGEFLYTSEDGTKTLIDIPASVIENIINKGDIYNEIINIIDLNETLTSIVLNPDDTHIDYTDEKGGLTKLDLTDLVRNLETTVSIVDGTNTTVESNTTGNHTEYKVNVATAEGTNLGVVKEAEDNATVTINQDGELAVNLENLNAVVHTAVNYIALPTDYTILGDASAGDIDIQLPAATPANKGKKYTIKKLDTNETNYIYVRGDVAGTNGKDLYTAIPYTGWDFISDGAKWHIINAF